VKYVSSVDWTWKRDILRANPKFHGQKRYDFTLIKVGTTTSNDAIFVQILQIFSLNFRGSVTPMALVIPLDVTLPRVVINRHRDKQLWLTQVRARPRASAVVINTQAIIRGGLLVKDRSSPMDYLVVEFVDEDMWTRLKLTQLVINARI